MKDILEEIVAWKRIEVEEQKKVLPPRQLYAKVESLMTSLNRRSMRQSLADSPYGIIAEFKRKSPSKGWIHPDVEPEDVVPEYARNGASALSILTDEKYFGGQAAFIGRMRPLVTTPILRKDFIIDEYQIFQARLIGADAILLIAADLSQETCKSMIALAHELGLEVLLEMHSEEELAYAELDADMIGINNRNLGTFHTDVENSFRLAELLPKDKLKVSESGISNPDTIRQLRQAGFQGFLIGETFMKETDPGLALKNFIEAL
ncbi:MAG: indole-3-glycerol phosphate synthase TrpC [Bacteroidaceae bacterium]|nr:indole-3-glycerol phosphate synthase TrpC [Bacteroidaceae bacterium]